MDQVSASYVLATKTLKGRLIAPYQREGVSWMLWRELGGEPKGGFLCDEMGLGKTVETIATMLGNPKNKTLLIVPKSIINQWVEQIEHFAPDLKVYTFDGPKRATDPSEFAGFQVIIAPYSLLTPKTSKTTVLHQVLWDRIILDEGHEIRNPRAKVTRSVVDLKGRIRWILTGTPVYNSMKDFVSLCNFLNIPKRFVLTANQKVKDTFILRRTKEDVSAHNIRLKLPPCDFENVDLELNEDEERLYRQVFTECQNKVKTIFKTAQNVSMHAMEILECLLRCRQVLTHPQIYFDGIGRKDGEEGEVWDKECTKNAYLLAGIMSHPTEKSLVFSQFVSEMDIIQSELVSRDVSVFRIDGSVSRENREEAIKRFKSSQSHSVFLIQIKAGGQGLNLQEATRVYITAPSWNPATELQAIGRSHRTGQSKKVVVKKLIYTGNENLPSIEEAIVNLQGAKSVVCATVLNDQRIVQQIPTQFKNRSMSIKILKKIFHV